MRQKPEERSEINLLTLIPERLIEWEKNDQGLVDLLKPKYRHPWLVRHLVPRLKRPHYRIRLDEIGSYFWENCDGLLSVREIADRQKSHFGDRVEPLYERIGLFLKSLERNRFITFRPAPPDRNEPVSRG